MTANMQVSENILNPLRQLYKIDPKFRTKIAEIAHNFKAKHYLLPQEFQLLQQRLNLHHIPFEVALFHRVLSEPLLSIELVPQTCWYSNVRDHVDQKTWDSLRKQSYLSAHHICEICFGKGNKWPVECHEIWHYNDQQYIQTLCGLIALCPSCHQVKHIGLADIQGKGEYAEQHLTKVNHWTKQQTAAYIEQVWTVWKQRSLHQWHLDLSWLETQGITVKSKRVEKQVNNTAVSTLINKIWG